MATAHPVFILIEDKKKLSFEPAMEDRLKLHISFFCLKRKKSKKANVTERERKKEGREKLSDSVEADLLE